MNFGFYISGRAARFNKILDIGDAEILESIKVVFSDDVKNDYLKSRLSAAGIPYILWNYDDIPAEQKDKNLFLSNQLLEVLKEYEIDYGISFGAHVLKGDLLEEYKNKIINFHPSLLPHFPGIDAIDQSVEAGCNIIGNTAHFIDEGVDTGPVILQSVQHIKAYYEKGYDGVLDTQVEIYKKLYYLLKNDLIKVTGRKVYIEGADYSAYHIFPQIKADTQVKKKWRFSSQ